MTELERLRAMWEIKTTKARYFRGVDTPDPELVRSILAEDCVLDFRGCCTDPATGVDFLPMMNLVMRGRASWSMDTVSSNKIVTVHHGHDCEIVFTSDRTADAIWSMSDRLYMPAGSAHALVSGFGYYEESYEEHAGAWLIKTLRIRRILVEGK